MDSITHRLYLDSLIPGYDIEHMECDIVCGFQYIHGDLHWTVSAEVTIDKSLKPDDVAERVSRDKEGNR